MSAWRIATITMIAATMTVGALAQGNGKGKGNGGGGGGGEDPPAEFVPVIAYKYEGKKYEDIRLSNIEGDQSCLVLRVQKDDPQGRLATFTISASQKRLVYSQGGALYLAIWTDDPCSMSFSSSPLVPQQPNDEGVPGIPHVDFSPDGTKLIWTRKPSSAADTRDIWIYDFSGGLQAPIDVGYLVRYPRFSPDFANSNEIFFTGRPTGQTGRYSVYGYDLAGGPVRTIADGLNYNVFIAVSNRDSSLGVRISAYDNDGGFLYQYDENGTQSGPPIAQAAGDLDYSCDNSRIVYSYAVNWRNNDILIANRNGSGATVWSSADLRDLDWICE